ncbi:DUF4145 domain-containing protein [Stappia indica]|uniref:DUF4145 domain-containing protein n=1 Tax=Stappia indica TaxID=538381 RepID=A0A285RQI6_9HYPH|nr:DUF4145 domain-containing protein [Stappia indica]SOB96393.1 protein of unknown function [Stappia indica]
MDRDPQLGRKSFCCPHCGSFSQQNWGFLISIDVKPEDFPEMEKLRVWSRHRGLVQAVISPTQSVCRVNAELGEKDNPSYLSGFYIAECASCGNVSIWREDKIIYPVGRAEFWPNKNMPEEVRADFVEAAHVFEKSPRGAAALLRLAVEKLVISLGAEGKNLNERIGWLVKDGMDRRIAKALDVVRVTGNNAVHPGVISFDDNEVARKLFRIVNIICETMITHRGEIDKLFEDLPERDLKAIRRRDEPTK